MKIAILHPSSADSLTPFKDLDPPRVPDHYVPEHEYVDFQIRKASAVRQVSNIARMGFDAAINLCDGAWDEDRPGIEVTQALERAGMAFTGAGSSFYDPSREAMKMACHSVGVKFPAYVLARHVDDAGAAGRLRFPLIVKHPQSYSSIGLTRHSRVMNAHELFRETARMVEAYGGALIEEFIEGREFTALVAEPRDDGEAAWVLDPIEFVFPEGESFKHFDLKWKDFSRMQTRHVADTSLAQRLRTVSALTFAALAGSGFGRCDLRMDTDGDIYLLEINPNCAVFYPEGEHGSADLILASDPAGHRGFLEHLLRCALRRRDLATKPWELRFVRDRGFGMVATCEIGAGSIIERYEARSHVLVSRRQVERQWKGLYQQWFQQYAWPLSSDIYVTWSDNPEEWRPINHACDPNTWLDGLDLVARREVAAGEELTVDYATFSGPMMSPFECQCGSPHCRKIIAGSDHLLPEIRERYGNHVSDFVRTAWQNSSPDWRPPYEIVHNSFGLGLVARRAWRAGEDISELRRGPLQRQASRWTVACSHQDHAEPLPFELRYINHSCAPNAQFDMERAALRALRDIAPGDELRVFYPATEWEMVESFECQCQAAGCIGLITGAAHLPARTLEPHVLSRTVRALLLRREARGAGTGELQWS